VDLVVVPGAKPFSVAATSDAGNATFQIDPSAGTWQSTIKVPTLAARNGDFSDSGWTIWDFSTCMTNGVCSPFAGTIIPLSDLPTLEYQATVSIPLPNESPVVPPYGFCYLAGNLPATGHFTSRLRRETSVGSRTVGGYLARHVGRDQRRDAMRACLLSSPSSISFTSNAVKGRGLNAIFIEILQCPRSFHDAALGMPVDALQNVSDLVRHHVREHAWQSNGRNLHEIYVVRSQQMTFSTGGTRLCTSTKEVLKTRRTWLHSVTKANCWSLVLNRPQIFVEPVEALANCAWPRKGAVIAFVDHKLFVLFRRT
jgi:hypothetical protein